MIELQSITKEYQMGTQTVHALRGVDLTIADASLLPSWARQAPARAR